MFGTKFLNMDPEDLKLSQEYVPDPLLAGLTIKKKPKPIVSN